MPLGNLSFPCNLYEPSSLKSRLDFVEFKVNQRTDFFFQGKI